MIRIISKKGEAKKSLACEALAPISHATEILSNIDRHEFECCFGRGEGIKKVI
jgi:hypothetical protein